MVNEGIIIADGLIKIKVLEINTSGRRPRVRLGIEAPKDINVNREEVQITNDEKS
jgi:carbon storage regulator CsrA